MPLVAGTSDQTQVLESSSIRPRFQDVRAVRAGGLLRSSEVLSDRAVEGPPDIVPAEVFNPGYANRPSAQGDMSTICLNRGTGFSHNMGHFLE